MPKTPIFILTSLLFLTTPAISLAKTQVDVVSTVNGEKVIDEHYSSNSDSVHYRLSQKVNNQSMDDQNPGQEQKATVREQVQERLEEHAAAKDEQRRFAVTRRCSFMKNFYRRLAHRFGNLLTRLQSRVQKLADLEYDTAPAEADLQEIADQQTQLDSAAAAVGTSCDQLESAEDLPTAIQDLKTSLTNFRDQAKSQRQLFVNLIHDLKILLPTPTESSTI
jgi:DNA repair exonuclease SbcCD ATPase subunit